MMKERNWQRIEKIRTTCYLLLAMMGVMVLGSSAYALSGPTSAELFEYAEWHVDNPSYSGNAFDVIADVTFTHTGSSETITTQMFYDGNDDWKFRFTGTKTGTWNFTTSSSDPELDGLSGSININPNSDPEALGFLVAAGQKYAWQVGNEGELRPIPKITYARNPETWFWGKDNSPTDNLNSYFAPALDEAASQGYDTWWITMRHAWFDWDAWSWNDHSNVNPDLTVFRMLENHIQDVHDRGLALDIRMWGDSAHAWTADGLPGGINGQVDQRLQRYIAARLGALPGWGLSYGFDTYEYLSPSQGEVFADYMNDHLDFPHMFWMRDEADDSYQSSSEPVVSVDDRPSNANEAYNDAISRFNEPSNNNRPVLFERNFDDGRWSDDRTRRGMWAFAMAGGAGAHYADQIAPDIDTFGEFWNGHERLLLDMEPNNGMSNDSDTWVIESPSRQSLVAYRRNNAGSIQLNLGGYGGSRAAVAVDTKSDYAEVDLGVLSASNQTIELDYASEWAIAVGDFGGVTPPEDTTPPSQVDGLSANAVSDSQIDLSWNAAGDPESGVASYNVYRDGGQVANVGGTSYSDTGLSPSTTYSYEIAAVNGAGLEGSKSSSVSETTDSITLRPPDNPADTTAGIEYEVFDGSWGSLPDFDSLTPAETGVMSVIDITAGRDGTDNFGMRWTGYVDVPADASYTFYTASDDGSQLFIGNTLIVDNDGLHGVVEESGTIGLEAGLHAITVTFFEAGSGEAIDVRFEGGGLSKQEIPAGNLYYTGDSPVDPPAAPSGLAASAVSSSRIDLSWTDNASDEDGFKIERKTGSGGTWSQIDTAGANATSYSNTGLSASTTYYYRVRAYNSGGDSAYSNEDSATTDDGTSPSGASIGVNFFNNGYGGYGLLDSDTAGVEAQTNWNNYAQNNPTTGLAVWNGSSWVAKGSQTYVDGDGNSTTLSVSYNLSNPVDGADQGTASGDEKLMSGTSQAGGGGTDSSSFSLSNVPYSTYDVIVYMAEPTSHSGSYIVTVTDGTTTYYIDEGGFSEIHTQSSATSEGAVSGEATYVRFSGLSGDNTISWNNNGSSWKAGAAGFQIVSADGGTVDPPPAPSGLAATTVSSSQIDLSWTDNASDEDGFKIERKTGSGGIWSQIDTAGANATSYSDTGLSASTAYYYRVFAYNSAGDSAYSNEDSATTNIDPDSYEAWKQSEFSGEELNDPDISGPLADPDNSGLVNLLRHAFGLSRYQEYDNALPQSSRDEENRHIFSHRRLLNPVDLQYVIKICDDLAACPNEEDWSTAVIGTDIVEVGTENVNNDTERVYYQVILDQFNSGRFLHLKVILE